MKRVCRLVVLFLALTGVLAPVAAQGEDSGLLLRFNAGLDLIDIGIAAGAGVGFRFPGPGGLAELTLDAYFGPYWETYTEGNTFDYTEMLVIIAARANWLFNLKAGRRGWYQVVGAGCFAGSYSWENYNRDTDYTEGNSYFASGTLINLGLGYVFNRTWEARVEVPILIFFGEYGEAAAIAIPITVGVLYRTK